MGDGPSWDRRLDRLRILRVLLLLVQLRLRDQPQVQMQTASSSANARATANANARATANARALRRTRVSVPHINGWGRWRRLRFWLSFADGIWVATPWGDSERYDFVLDVRGECGGCRLSRRIEWVRMGGIVSTPMVILLTAYRADEIDLLVAYVVPEDVCMCSGRGVGANAIDEIVSQHAAEAV